MNDQCLLNPLRILQAIWVWVWWVAAEEEDMPFWDFIRHHRRMNKPDKRGVYYWEKLEGDKEIDCYGKTKGLAMELV